MKSYKKTRGAVSVFLVLILVPCLLASSIFVDVSRVELAKGDTLSAADNALNALLAHFDTDLNDWYGMVASCQNIDEFYAQSKNYFLSIVTSQDLIGGGNTSSDSLGDVMGGVYDYITGSGSGELSGDVTNLLMMECLSAEISEVSDADLTNAAMMKAEITEFMKYRAPIELVTGLIERLKNDPSSKGVTEVEKNEPLVDKKSKYYEAEGELLSASFKTYRALMRYYNKAEEFGFSKKTPAQMLNDLENYKEAYRQINKVLVRHMVNTKGLKPYELLVMKDRMEFWDGQFKEDGRQFTQVYSRSEEDDSGETVYYISNSKLTQLVSNAKTAGDTFESSIEALVTAAGEMMKMKDQIGYGDGQINPVQWWKRMDEATRTKQAAVKDAGEALVKALAKLKSAKDNCEFDEDVSTENKNNFTRQSDRLKKIYDKCLSGNRTYSKNSGSNLDAYLSLVVTYESICKENADRLTPDSKHEEDMILIGGSKYTVREAEEEIRKKMTEQLTQLTTCMDNLTKIVDGDPDGIGNGSLDELAELAKKYRETFHAWKDEAYSSDTEMGAEDRREIEGGYEDSKKKHYDTLKFAEQINEEAVEILKTRLNNIHEQLEILARVQFSEGKKDPSYMSYLDTGLASFFGADNLVQKARNTIGKSRIDSAGNNQELNAYAKEMFNQHFTPKPEEERKVTQLKDTASNDYNPDIDPKDPDYQQEETPYLFVFFYSQWKHLNEENFKEFDKQEKEKEEAKEKVDDFSKEQKEKSGKYRGPDGHDIQHDYSEGARFKASSLVGALAGTISNLVSGNFSEMRDQLYLLTYMTGMFSCATFDREGAFRLLTKEQQKELDGGNFQNYYAGVKGGPTEPNTWLSERYQDSYNKSLTGKMINEENNRAYLAEQEYILFGKESNKDNVKQAFDYIYTIRYTLNLVSCFQHFWNNSTIVFIATALSAATFGIIPPAAFKVVLLLMYTAAETAIDNLRLSYGFPVELYKTKADDWVINLKRVKSFGAFADILTGKPEKLVKNKNNKGIFYSDYIAVFLLLGVQNGGKLQTAMIQRTGELVQANLRQKGLEDFSMKNSKVYFSLNSQIRVRPLMVTLPLFEGEAGDMESRTDWCTYTVKMTRGYI